MSEPNERMAAWLADRRGGITSGDVISILGLGRDGPMKVWLDKLGLAEPTEQNERMTWGLRLQKAILEGYADRVEHPIQHADPYAFVRYPAMPILGATLDARWADADRRPVDAKNIGIKRPDQWGADGSAIIPYGYAVQLTVQMMVTGTDVADLAVLFGGNKLEVFTVERDEATCQIIREAAERFWHDHVLPRLPPTPDGSEGWRRFLQTIPQRRGDLVPADDATVETVRQLVEIRKGLGILQADEAALEAKIKVFIGEHAGITTPMGKVTWKQAVDGEKVNWEGVAKSTFDYVGLDPGDADAITRQHTAARPGSRRLWLSLKGDDDGR